MSGWAERWYDITQLVLLVILVLMGAAYLNYRVGLRQIGMHGYETLKIALLLMLVALLLAGIGFLNFKINERNIAGAEEVAAWKQAMEAEIERRWSVERAHAKDENEKLSEKVDEVKDLANKALRKSPPVVLAVKTPVPVQIVAPPTVPPTPTIPDTNPKRGGLFGW